MPPPQKKAVALGYEKTKDSAPRLLAKAIGPDAELIEILALDSGVQVEKNPLLAQALYDQPLLSEIPAELYEVIACLYARLYEASKKEWES